MLTSRVRRNSVRGRLMSEQGNDVSEPAVRTSRGPSIIWIVPMVTLIVGAWLVVRTLSDQAPTATIAFPTAEGIEAGKTPIKYKNVDIGLVEEIQFAENYESVVLSVELNEGLDDFLRRNTRFWVVRPQLSVRGVSGLNTLISGAYIEIDPGPGAPQKHFIGLEEMPLIRTDDAGTRITLIADELGSLGRGSPIYYQGILAGETLGFELANDNESVYVHAFVRDPYDQLLKGNSRFWNVSGIDLEMGADGVQLKTASVASLLFGGIAFDTPETREQTVADVSDLVYTLHPGFSAIEERAYTRRIQFVMYFTGSVRGLNPGAPVEFRGIRIGEVIDIRMEFDADDLSFRIPVVVELEPDRITSQGGETLSPEQTIATLVDKGLRARLQTGNLLTGQLFVEMNMYPEAEVNLVADENQQLPELPTIPGAFETITNSLSGIVAKLETVDMQALGDNLVEIVRGTSELINKDQHEETVTDLQASMRSFRRILDNVEEGDVDNAIKAATDVLNHLDETLTMVDDVLEPNAPLQYNLIQVTEELEETARSVRALVETLERQPNAVIFGRQPQEEEN